MNKAIHRIALVWYFNQAHDIYPLWRDGHRAAFELLSKHYQVDWYMGTDFNVPQGYDFYLLWDSSNSDYFSKLDELKGRKGLCLTTDWQLSVDNLRRFDVVFAEAQPVVDACKPAGVRVLKAFGTDSNFFVPNKMKQIYGAIYPATFSPWKRQDIFAEEFKGDGLCVGTIQPDGIDIYRRCKELGTNLIIGYLPVEALKVLYDVSGEVVITGYEGSGRTVLESLSMNKPIRVHPDNLKGTSYIDEWKESGLSGRDFILENYSGEKFCEQLIKGIEEK